MDRILDCLRLGGAGDGPGARAAALLEISADPLLALDLKGLITAANPPARALLGCDPVARPIGWAEICLSLVENGRRRGAVLHLRDVTERAQRLGELERLALHDGLTALPNRLLLEDWLRQGLLEAQRRNEPLAVLLLDLNGFEQVNDALGRHVGDRLLQHVASRLAGPLRRSDTLARVGGNECAVLLPPPTDLDQAVVVAEQLVLALVEPIVVDGIRLEVGASIDLALYPGHGLDAESLMQRVGAAMYAAKRSGLGFAICDQPGPGDAAARQDLPHELQDAIERDRLPLLFQPKVEARSFALAGVEVLVAWDHPELGLLRAPDFLHMAEHIGLVLPLTLAVLNGCLRQQQRWRQAGRIVSVAVKLTPRWLLDDRFPQLLRMALRNWEGRPAELPPEATEGAITADPRRAHAVLEAVAKLGCRVAVDDFGTGYSCLAHPQRLPVAELKIDRGFVAEMPTNRNAAVIMRGIVRLAHGLGLRVAAGGVETEDTALWLGTLGCDELQGYLFGWPMRIEELDRWLAQPRAIGAAEAVGA